MMGLVFLSCQNATQHYEFVTSAKKRILVTETHPKGESQSTLNIWDKDFKHTKKNIILEDVDPIDAIFLEDLDEDGLDELYIITKGVGSGQYAGIIGFASDTDGSLRRIEVPEIQEQELSTGKLFYGYMGKDDIRVKNGTLVREFPVFLPSDTNDAPSGQMKEVRYRLVKKRKKRGHHDFKLAYISEDGVTAEFVRDCTGSYLRIDMQDYKICNASDFDAIITGTVVEAKFEKTLQCTATEDKPVCLMQHEFEGWINISNLLLQ